VGGSVWWFTFVWSTQTCLKVLEGARTAISKIKSKIVSQKAASA